MTLERLVENSIISDLSQVPALAPYPIRNYDYIGQKAGDNFMGADESQVVLTVSAKDNGEFKVGSGIRKVGVEVEVRVNVAAENSDGTLLDQLSEAVQTRLQPTPNVFGASGREYIFNTPSLKVFGITSAEPTQRTISNLERIRTVARTFIASKIL